MWVCVWSELLHRHQMSFWLLLFKSKVKSSPRKDSNCPRSWIVPWHLNSLALGQFVFVLPGKASDFYAVLGEFGISYTLDYMQCLVLILCIFIYFSTFSISFVWKLVSTTGKKKKRSLQLLISQLRLFISDNCLWVYFLQFWIFSINSVFCKIYLQDINSELWEIKLQFLEKCLGILSFFFYHRIKNKKGNCDILSHNSDISSQICKLICHNSEVISCNSHSFFLRIARKRSDTFFIIIPCQKWTSLHLLCRICKKTCCTS